MSALTVLGGTAEDFRMSFGPPRGSASPRRRQADLLVQLSEAVGDEFSAPPERIQANRP